MCLISQSKVGVGDSPGFGFAVGLKCYISLWHITHFILKGNLIHTYIKCFNTFYCGWHWQLAVIWMQFQPDICWVSHSNSNVVVGVGKCVDYTLEHVLDYDWDTPHSSYSQQIFVIHINALWHLLVLLCFLVIKRQPQPDICWVSQMSKHSR